MIKPEALKKLEKFMDFIQWPAMAVILVASWLAASQRAKRRKLAFLGFIVGNLLWIVWGLYVEAYALALLDGILCAMNIRFDESGNVIPEHQPLDALSIMIMDAY